MEIEFERYRNLDTLTFKELTVLYNARSHMERAELVAQFGKRELFSVRFVELVLNDDAILPRIALARYASKGFGESISRATMHNGPYYLTSPIFKRLWEAEELVRCALFEYSYLMCKEDFIKATPAERLAAMRNPEESMDDSDYLIFNVYNLQDTTYKIGDEERSALIRAFHSRNRLVYRYTRHLELAMPWLHKDKSITHLIIQRIRPNIRNPITTEEVDHICSAYDQLNHEQYLEIRLALIQNLIVRKKWYKRVLMKHLRKIALKDGNKLIRHLAKTKRFVNPEFDSEWDPGAAAEEERDIYESLKFREEGDVMTFVHDAMVAQHKEMCIRVLWSMCKDILIGIWLKRVWFYRVRRIIFYLMVGMLIWFGITKVIFG